MKFTRKYGVLTFRNQFIRLLGRLCDNRYESEAEERLDFTYFCGKIDFLGWGGVKIRYF